MHFKQYNVQETNFFLTIRYFFVSLHFNRGMNIVGKAYKIDNEKEAVL